MRVFRYCRLVLIAAAVVSASILAACDEKLSDIAGPSPNLQPTFTSIQHEIFETTDASGRAACTNCHTDVGGRTPSCVLNLRHDVAYASLVSVASRGKAGAVRVIPGDAVNSYIVRYRTETTVDGLPPGEGVFLPCTFWLVDNLALQGRVAEATAMFERLLDLRNDVGLRAEEYDPSSGRQLGNFPQAFTHVGLVNSAHNLGTATVGPATERTQ